MKRDHDLLACNHLSLGEFSDLSKNGRPFAVYTEFQTRLLVLLKFRFLFFQQKAVGKIRIRMQRSACFEFSEKIRFSAVVR